MTRASTSLLAALVLLVAGCGGDDPPPPLAAPQGLPHEVREPPRPAAGTVVVVHGGAWFATGPDDVAGIRPEADRLRAAGWRTVNVDYREGGASIEDVVAWVDAVDRSFPDGPVCLFGESAGGHLALLAAARRPDVVHCVIGHGAVTDPASLGTTPESAGLRDDAARRAFGDDLASVSPVGAAQRITAKVMLGTGAADRLVPCDQLDRFKAAQPAAQVGCLPAGDVPFVHAPVERAALDALHAAEADLLRQVAAEADR